MRFLRLRLSALAIIVAVVAGTSVPRVAAAQMQGACARSHHDCGGASVNAKCCCRGHSSPSRQPAPVPSRIQLSTDLTPALAAAGSALRPDLGRVSRCVYRLPPRTHAVDLPTLFSSLLI